MEGARVSRLFGQACLVQGLGEREPTFVPCRVCLRPSTGDRLRINRRWAGEHQPHHQP